MGRRRVVVTGLGCVSPLGLGVDATWNGLVEGRSGIGPIRSFDASDHTTQFAGECWDYAPEDHFPKVEAKKLDRFSQFAMVAAKEALEDSGILGEIERGGADARRVGVILGSGIGGINELEQQHAILLKRGPRRINPFFVPKLMVNAMSGQISIRFGLEGTCFATSSACASASHALGLALRSIQSGESDVVVSGGSEATITPLTIGGFNALKALSTRNDAPEAASRPFDRGRDGFVMGEGCAILMLEELEHAKARGAKIYGEFAGFGSTADAHHITAPREDGAGPTRAMQIALEDGGLTPGDVQYVNAHGTSTEYNDVVETVSLKQVFGDHAPKLAVSSTKSMVGHLLGAAGAIGALACVLSTHHDTVHPTINLEEPDERCDLDYVPGSARPMKVDAAIGNALGFGGHNVCVAFRSYR